MEDYYKILDIPETATENDIKHAYRLLVKKYHPDSREARENQSDAKEKFLKIKEAYETLSDREKRARYDETRTSGVNHRLLKAKKEYHKGTRAYEKGRYEEAVYHFRNAVEIDNKSALYCSWLGMSLLEQKGSIHEAKKWCEQAVKLNPSNADYLVNLALVYKKADANTSLSLL